MAGLSNAKAYLKKYRKRTIWHRALTCMAAVVVFCTTYALVLPALTLEIPTTCGIEEHTHTVACYVDSGSPLLCEEAIKLHQHDDSCRDEAGELICGYADFVLHTHDESCYNADGALRCPLPEIKSYTVKQPKASGFLDGLFSDLLGTDSTTGSALDYTPTEDATQEEAEVEYEDVEITEPHTHDDSCYELEDGAISEVPVCGLLEVYVHTHTAECFADETLICGKEEHQHGEECYLEYKCGLEEHQHGEDCYDAEGNLICGKEEHIHDENCKALLMMNGLNMLLSTGITVDLPVTNITGGGTTYDPTTGDFDTKLNIDFEFDKPNVIQSGTEYVFNYPKGVIVPEDLLGHNYDLLKDRKKTGEYCFEKNEDGTYSVHIMFDDGYVNTAGDHVIGHVDFSGTLQTKTGEDGSIKIPVGTSGLEIKIPSTEITYPSDETDRYDIDVTKGGGYIIENDKLVYTVFIYSRNGTPDPIEFHDVLTMGDLKLGTPTVTVEQSKYQHRNQHYRPTIGEFVPVTVTPSYENNTIQMNLPGLPAGVEKEENSNKFIEGYCYRITYTYDLAEMNITQESPKNVVTVTSKDENKGQIVTDHAECNSSVNKQHTFSKSGNYDSENKEIDWTINVNNNRVNIAGAELSDEMLKLLNSGNDISIKPATGYELKKDDAGKIIGIKFTATNADGTNKNCYEITYSTAAERKWGEEQTIRNKATFDPTPGPETSGDEQQVEAKVTLNDGSVSKWHGEIEKDANKEFGTIKWTVEVDMPSGGLPANSVIEDQITADAGQGHWMTATQVLAWRNQIKWKNGDQVCDLSDATIELFGSDGNSYRIDSIDENSSLHFTGYCITLPKGLKSPSGKDDKLTLSYETTVDLKKTNGAGKVKYANTVKVNEKEVSSSYEYEYHTGKVEKTDGNDSPGETQISNQDGTLIWKVKATTSDADTETLTVIDTLPEGIELNGITLSGAAGMTLFINENGGISGSSNGYSVTGSYDVNTRQVQLSLTRDNNGKLEKNREYVFQFNCKVKNLDSIDTGKTYPFTNSVTVWEDETELGSATQTQDWTYQKPVVEKKVVDKTGSWDNDNRLLHYSVLINPEGKDLIPGTEYLTLKDELEYKSSLHWKDGVYEMQVTLIPSELKLYKMILNSEGELVKGEEVQDWKWTYSSVKNTNDQYGYPITNTVTITGIPDSTPLCLEYGAEVSTTLPKGSELDLSIKNKAILDGTTYWSEEGLEGKKWKDSQTSGTVDDGFTFQKVETGNYNAHLQGATFTVYSYSPNGDYTNVPAITTYTTDETGAFQIKRKYKEGTEEREFLSNTLYTVIETAAPKNYELPEPVEEYYFYFSDGDDTTHTLPEELPPSAVDLSKEARTVYAENTRNTTDIRVKKVWKDSDCNVVVPNSGSVTIKLYQRASDNPNDFGENADNGRMAILRGDVKDSQGRNLLETPQNYSPGTILKFKVIGKYQIPNLEEYKKNKISPKGDACGTVIFNGKEVPAGEVNMTLEGDEWTKYEVWVYTYSIEIKNRENNLCVDLPDWHWHCEGFEKTLPSDSLDTEVGQVTLGFSENPEETEKNPENDPWRHEFKGLPLSGTENGKTVYYYYYIQEIDSDGTLANYDVYYENNGGITNGNITVINQEKRKPVYELPSTGGPGVRAYTTAGLLLMMAAAVVLFYRKNTRRKEDSASS